MERTNLGIHRRSFIGQGALSWKNLEPIEKMKPSDRNNNYFIIIQHDLNRQDLFIRLLFNQISRDGRTYLTRYYDGEYQVEKDLDLSNSVEEAIPYLHSLLGKFQEEYKELNKEFDIPDLSLLDDESLKNKILEDFDPESDIQG
ncbi:MAG: hypothetical protein ACJATI_001511 [Halioglobus sp.]|jgi:hypothetical protein